MNTLPLNSRLNAGVTEALRLLRLAHGPREWPEARPFPGISAEDFEVPPTVYDPTHLDRVTRCGFGSSLVDQKAVLDATALSATSPRIIEFRDVTCLGGRIYSAGKSFHASALRPYRQFFTRGERYDCAVVTNSVPGLRYFGNWLRDDCAARMLPLDEFGSVTSLARPNWPDSTFYASHLNQSWVDSPAFFARHLTAVTELGFNHSKAERWRCLRARLRAAASSETKAKEMVYIRRGASGVARAPVNEDALAEVLAKNGVTIVEPETGNSEMINALLDARLIIGVEGSQLTHAVYTIAERGALLVLQPPDRFYNPHREWTGLLGLGYGIVVGTSLPNGFAIDPGEVLDMAARLIS